MEKKLVKIGGAWKHESSKGTKYFSGQVKLEKDLPAGSTLQLVMFKNGYKEEGDKKPDLIIYLGDNERAVPEDVF